MDGENTATQIQAEPTFEQQTAGFVTHTTEPERPAAETPSAESTEQQGSEANAETAETTEQHDEAPQEQRQQKPQKGTAQARIQELLAKNRQAEERHAAERRDLETRLAALEKQGLTEKQRSDTSATSDGPPDPDAKNADGTPKYQYGELDTQYLDDRAEWKVEQKLKAREAAAEKKKQDDAAQQRLVEMREKATKFEAAGNEEFDDFNEVVIDGFKNGNYPVSDTVAELIFDSEAGPKIAHHLATHPDEARQIASLPASKQAAAFGRLEAKFSSVSSDAARAQPAQVKATQAPPPPKNSARGGGSKTGFDPKTASFEQFEAHMKGQAAK